MNDIAKNLFNQIGMQAFVMLGAVTRSSTSVVATDDGLMFGIKGCAKINRIVIRLQSDDTYTLSFWKIPRPRSANACGACELIAEVEMVHADQLRQVIEHHTGLRMSLGVVTISR